MKAQKFTSLLVAIIMLLTPVTAVTSCAEISDSDSSQKITLSAPAEDENYYDIYSDNSLKIPVPNEGSFLTTSIGEFDYYDFENGTVACYGYGTIISGIKYAKIPYMVNWGGEDRTVSGIMNKAFEYDDCTEVIELPNTIERIYMKVFSNMTSIKRICIPVSVKEIADDAFENMPSDFKIICVKDSYAEEYAKANNIPYSYPEDDDFDKKAVENSQKSIEDLEIYINGYKEHSLPMVFEYTGHEILPEVVIINDGQELNQNTDYTVSYSHNKDVGRAYIVIMGKNKYRGIYRYSFEIKKLEDIIPFDLSKENTDFYDLYTDNGVNIAKPWCGSFDDCISGDYNFQSNDNGTVVFWGANENVIYVKIPAVIQGGYYYGRPDIAVEVRHDTLRKNSVAQVVEIPNTIIYIEEGAFSEMKSIKRIYVPISVKQIDKGVFENMPSDFKLICVKDSYAEEYAKANNIPYSYPEDDDFDKKAVENLQRSIEDLDIYVDGSIVHEKQIPFIYEYTGNEIKPNITIKDGNKTLVLDTDYTVKYGCNKNVGTAYINVSGKNNYKGFCFYYFEIKKHEDIMPYDPIMGDIDGDSRITSNDALIALRASVGEITLDDEQKVLADIDLDGDITSVDALGILRISASID